MAQVPNLASESSTSASVLSNRKFYFIVMEDTRLLDRGTRVTGQFTPKQVRLNKGSNIVEGGGYNRESPIIQWAGGTLEEITLQARFFSEHAEDITAQQKYEIMNYLSERDSQLRRPPLVAFYWGIVFPEGFPCLIQSPGGIEFDDNRDDGSTRGLILNFTLKKHTQFLVEQVATTRERTPRYTVRDGDTYESIAREKYGDPMMGVLLRQLNPRSPMVDKAPSGVGDLQAGEQVKIFNPNELARERIRPLSHMLRKDTRLALSNRRYFFDLRSNETSVLPRR